MTDTRESLSIAGIITCLSTLMIAIILLTTITISYTIKWVIEEAQYLILPLQGIALSLVAIFFAFFLAIKYDKI